MASSSKRPSVRVESHRSSPTKLYDFAYAVDMTQFPTIKIRVSARTISTVSPKRLLAMNWQANVYIGEQYPKIRLAGRVCTSQYTVSPQDLDFTSTSKDYLELVLTNISAFPLSVNIKPTSHHISVSCMNPCMIPSNERKVIQVRKSESFDTFWTSSLKLQQNSDVQSENIVQAFGSPVRTMSVISLTHTLCCTKST